ncbi:MAG: hypothetical protein K0R51_3190 [Cytophagaceae bacterium]|jgi:hypothetical protein|nr:hypothetical protein [Cytophagaceae bacterium]
MKDSQMVLSDRYLVIWITRKNKILNHALKKKMHTIGLNGLKHLIQG